MTTIRQSDLPDLIHRGKVRDTHELDSSTLLMVATDRISAFDVVLPTPIPEKGAVLNQMSAFWFEQTKHIVPNHFIALATDRSELSVPSELARRAMVARRAERIDVECVIRGYITGSAWAEYRRSGTVSDHPMPSGLREGDRFPEPRFTPTTKAEVGHDENMSFQDVVDMVGIETADKLSETSKASTIRSRRRPRQGHHHRRHEDGVRVHRRPSIADRRAADARLQPVLGCDGLRARQIAAQLRQAVRQRLAR